MMCCLLVEWPRLTALSLTTELVKAIASASTPWNAHSSAGVYRGRRSRSRTGTESVENSEERTCTLS